MPEQDKGVIPVGPIIPWQGCSSAEPASASPDGNSITQEKKLNKSKRLLSSRLYDDSLKSERFVLLH